MQKIIKGKKYDTKTAKEVCGYSNSLAWEDFNRLNETLYYKRTGEFFLYGTGGAKSKYAVPDGNGWGAGEAIIPLSETEAKAFVEEYGDSQTYEKYFGTLSENDTICTNIKFSAATYKKLQTLALKENKSKSQIISELINQA